MMLSVVIVNFNTLSDLKNCLSSIYKYTKNIRYEIIVIDNASTDGSPQMVQHEFPRVRLLANKINFMFGQGYHQGLRIARGQYLLVLAPDIIFQENSLAKLIRFLKTNPNAGLISCRQITKAGKLNPTCHQFPHPITEIMEMPFFYHIFKNHDILRKLRYANWDRRGIKKVEVIPGSFMLGSRDVFTQAGFMDKKYKIYYSDTDLSLKVTQNGWVNYHNGETTVVHLVAQTTKLIQLPKLMAISYQDMLYYYRKNFGISWTIILYIFSRLSLGYFWLRYNLLKKY